MSSAEWERYRVLNKMRKAELCALYRKLGHVWSAHPIETWRKDEVVSGILEIEFREERAAERANAPEDFTAALVHAVDTTKPYGYRVDRADEDDPERATLSSGYSDGAQKERGTVAVAQEQVRSTRTGHSYYGPLRVYVWQQRDQEHYRMPVPENADRYEFAAVPAPETPARGYVD